MHSEIATDGVCGAYLYVVGGAVCPGVFDGLDPIGTTAWPHHGRHVHQHHDTGRCTTLHAQGWVAVSGLPLPAGRS